MQKLGEDPLVWHTISQNDYEVEKLIYEISEQIGIGDYEEAKLNLNTLVSNKYKLDMPAERFIKSVQITLDFQDNKDAKKAIEDLKELIPSPLKALREGDISKYGLTEQDIVILNEFACMCTDSDNERELGIKILEGLRVFIKDSIKLKRFYARLFAMISYNLSIEVGKNDLKRCLRICDEAISWCLRYDCISSLAGLSFNKAYAIIELELKDEYHEEYIRQLLLQSLSLYNLKKSPKNKEAISIIISYIEEKGIKIKGYP